MTASSANSPASPLEQKMTSRQKQIRVATVLVPVLVVAGLGIARFSGALVWPDDSDPVPSSAESVAGTVEPDLLSALVVREVPGYGRTLTYSGTVRSAHHTEVAFPRGGLVTRVLVEEGQSVSPGQPLAELDSRHLQAQFDALTAKLDQARARLAEMRKGPRMQTIAAARASVDDLTQQLNAARLRLDRSRKLLETSAIADQEYERELYTARGLEARLQTAQSQLDELLAGTRKEQVTAQQALLKSIESDQQVVQYQLDDCLLTAPFAGMIVDRMIDPGAVVDTGEAVVELIDHLNLELHVGIPRENGGRWQPGQACTVLAGESSVPAVLRTVLPTVDSATQTRRAIFELDCESLPGDLLVEGQLAQIRLMEPVTEPGFWVPASAITSDHSGLWSCLTLDTGGDPLEPGTSEQPAASGQSPPTGLARKQSIEVLHHREGWLFVRGTLADGQLLLTDGLQRVVPGQQAAARIDPNPEYPGEDLLEVTSLRPVAPAPARPPGQQP